VVEPPQPKIAFAYTYDSPGGSTNQQFCLLLNNLDHLLLLLHQHEARSKIRIILIVIIFVIIVCKCLFSWIVYRLDVLKMVLDN